MAEQKNGVQFSPRRNKHKKHRIKSWLAAAAAVLAPVAARVRQSGRELWYALPDPEAVGRVRSGCRENVARAIYVESSSHML